MKASKMNTQEKIHLIFFSIEETAVNFCSFSLEHTRSIKNPPIKEKHLFEVKRNKKKKKLNTSKSECCKWKENMFISTFSTCKWLSLH